MTQKEIIEGQKARVVTDLDEVFTADSAVHVIIMSEDSLPNYASQIKATSKVIVGVEWLRDCMLQNTYASPERYSLLAEAGPAPVQIEFKITLERLNHLMNRLDSTDKMLNYLANCFIYLFKLEPEEEALQKKLAHFGGGIHMSLIIPNITHIVVDKYEEDDLKDFTRFSNVHVVNIAWLRECLHFKNRLPEGDFFIKPQLKATSLNPKNRQALPASSKNATLGLAKPAQSLAAKKPQLAPLSELFEGVYFYFLDKNDANLKKWIRKVLTNSGQVIKELESVKENKVTVKGYLYLVLPDGYDEAEVNQAKEGIDETKLHLISVRWIEYCIERSVVVKDFKEKRMGYLMPFPHKTPYASFLGLCFFVDDSRLQLDTRANMLRTVEALGGKTTTNKADGYDFELVFQAADGPAAPNVRDFKWLIGCLKAGTIDAETLSSIPAK